MASKLFFILSALLVGVTTVMATPSVRQPSPLHAIITKTDVQDDLGTLIYSWEISQDEQDRLSVMLGHDFYETGVKGTYLNSEPHICPYCGKQTEFIDWVFTALARGVHSPEFLIEALREGRSPKNTYHDVYCSRCGHLTPFRAPSGTEGNARHIDHALPFDRATGKFWVEHGIHKREDTVNADSQNLDTPPATGEPERRAGWCQRCVAGNWIIKREAEPAPVAEAVVEPSPLAGWCQRCVAGNWIIKREEENAPVDKVDSAAEDTVDPVPLAGWCQRCVAGNWIIKREAEADAAPELAATVGTVEAAVEPSPLAGWCQRCVAGNWIIKREAADAIVEADVVEEVAKPTPLAGWCQRCTAGNWIIKREATDEVEDPVPATAETVEPKPLAGWCQRCVAGNWIIKREEDIIYESNW